MCPGRRDEQGHEILMQSCFCHLSAAVRSVLSFVAWGDVVSFPNFPKAEQANHACHVIPNNTVASERGMIAEQDIRALRSTRAYKAMLQ